MGTENSQKLVHAFNELSSHKSDNRKGDFEVCTEYARSEYLALEMARFEGDTQLKKYLAFFVMIFTSAWSALTFITLWTSGQPSTVIITLLTTTFGYVLGLPYIITSHLFPKEKDKVKLPPQ